MPGSDSGGSLTIAETGMTASRCAHALGFLLVAAGFCSAQDTTRVSVDSSGSQANNNSLILSISASSHVVGFTSSATNLVANDTNGCADIFVHDRITGITERISIDSSGAESNGISSCPSMSADGQFVAFLSSATNLIPNDLNAYSDIFVHDRVSGTTECVSVDSVGTQSNGLSGYPPSISYDGTLIAFPSRGSNLVPGDNNIHADIFVHDRVSGNTERVSVDSSGNEQDGNSYACAISGDGSIVAFESDATNLISGDTNKVQDVFVHDRISGITERISIDSLGTQGNGKSWSPMPSSDGRMIAFWSDATNLVANDTNGYADVFIRDRASGTTDRVSVDSAGGQSNGLSSQPSISGDGRYVVFASLASNLVTGDTNVDYDIFLRDVATGSTTRVSIDSSGHQATGGSMSPSISADGQVIAFDSWAPNLVSQDTNGFSDVFVHVVFDASWINYGFGFAGTNGIPTFTSQSPPRIGTTIALDAGDSQGSATSGALFVGFQRGSFHSSWGGDLLLVPTLVTPVAIAPGGVTFTADLPDDAALVGIAVDLQVIELDAGATKGVSFTPGLELVLGQ
jgi:Tol biopolymer transport system component